MRTPIGRHGGILKDVRPDDLAALVIAEALRRANVDPALVEEVYFGLRPRDSVRECGAGRGDDCGMAE